MNESDKRLLVIAPTCLAELVMAQSLFITLKQRDPDAMLGVIAGASFQSILARMPEVDDGLVLDVAHGKLDIKKRWALAAKLKGRYDRAIVLPSSWKAALVPFLSRIPERVGFLGAQRYGLIKERRTRDIKILDKTVKCFVSLGLPEDEARTGQFIIPPPRLTIDRDNLVNLRMVHQLSSRPSIGLMPGANAGRAGRWPLTNFHELAERLVSNGYEVRIFGGPNDQHSGDVIANGLKHTHNLCGKTGLADAADLLADCHQAVTNDCGLMHVAAAVGTRVHTVYHPTAPANPLPTTLDMEKSIQRQ